MQKRAPPSAGDEPKAVGDLSTTVTRAAAIPCWAAPSGDAFELILDVLKLFDVVPVDEERLRRAVEMNWKDFEDAVQAACAEAVAADYLVTRDKKGFRAATVDVITPGELVALLQS